MVLNTISSGKFPLQPTEGTNMLACISKVFDCFSIETLTPKAMPQKLPIALAQVKAGKTSENLLN